MDNVAQTMDKLKPIINSQLPLFVRKDLQAVWNKLERHLNQGESKYSPPDILTYIIHLTPLN